MKKFALTTLLFVVLAFTTGTLNAEIKLTDNLSLSGFLDMSTVIGSHDDHTDASLSFDQFELDFHLDYGSVTGRIDIDSTDTDQGIKLEQGFVTYTLPEDVVSGVSITAGRFLSSFGFEAAEPTGLYQYSFSEGIPYPGYQNGVAVNVSPVKEVGIYLALLSGVWDVNDTDVKDPGVEAQLSLMPIDQITAKVGYAMDMLEDYSQSELNAWAQFTQGPLTLAGEIDLLGNWGADGNNGIHFLGMANVSLEDAISAPVAVTLRFSGINLDDTDSSTEFTFSPSYAATDNWLLLAEFKRRIDAEETIIAAESLFTF
ncbi:MAG: outer membrane beta-barrel protein [Candidatus Poribacteria bacterium]|nr:outer membrane beta-barrel protein [Candidatus Poribacteria bacterium]